MENNCTSPPRTPHSPNSNNPNDINKRSDYVSDLIYPLLIQKLDNILAQAKMKVTPDSHGLPEQVMGKLSTSVSESNGSTTSSPMIRGEKDSFEEEDGSDPAKINSTVQPESRVECADSKASNEKLYGDQSGCSYGNDTSYCSEGNGPVSTFPDPADVPSLKEQLIRSGLLSSSDPIFTSPVNKNSNLKPIIPRVPSSTLDIIRSNQRNDNHNNECTKLTRIDTSNNVRDLTEKLLRCKTDILLKTTENLPCNNQLTQGLDALDKLVKTEQLIQLLQANQQELQRTTGPSIILGGSKNTKKPSLLNNKRKTEKEGTTKRANKKVKHCGGSHPIQLWHFILELLGDVSNKNIISWTGNGLEFRILNSVELARLWGIRKCNPIMNFDKLSRALRYYYEKNIIKHNPMHRLVYSFCSNPHDIAYNALLNKALISCPIDPECAKNQAAFAPYSNSGNTSIPISVSLQTVHNMSHITDNKTSNTSISVTEQ